MFPLRDDNPTFRTSFATFTIIGINIAVWVFIQGLGFNPLLAESICKFGLIPGELLGTLTPGARIQLGPNLTCLIEEGPQAVNLVVSMFMHGGWFHLIGNMWFLYIFGDNVEDVMGPVRFVLFYIACGLAAAAAQIISSPSSAVPMVGASGAIGGVMGAYALLFPRAPVHLLVFFGFFFTRVVVPAFLMLGYWFLLQFLGGFSAIGAESGVAFWAHIGGFLAGVGLIRYFCKTHRLEICRGKKKQTHRMFYRI